MPDAIDSIGRSYRYRVYYRSHDRGIVSCGFDVLEDAENFILAARDKYLGIGFNIYKLVEGNYEKQ